MKPRRIRVWIDDEPRWASYVIEWDEALRDTGGGNSVPEPTLHIVERPDGFQTWELEDACWEDFERQERIQKEDVI